MISMEKICVQTGNSFSSVHKNLVHQAHTKFNYYYYFSFTLGAWYV